MRPVMACPFESSALRDDCPRVDVEGRGEALQQRRVAGDDGEHLLVDRLGRGQLARDDAADARTRREDELGLPRGKAAPPTGGAGGASCAMRSSSPSTCTRSATSPTWTS